MPLNIVFAMVAFFEFQMVALVYLLMCCVLQYFSHILVLSFNSKPAVY